MAIAHRFRRALHLDLDCAAEQRPMCVTSLPPVVQRSRAGGEDYQRDPRRFKSPRNSQPVMARSEARSHPRRRLRARGRHGSVFGSQRSRKDGGDGPGTAGKRPLGGFASLAMTALFAPAWLPSRRRHGWEEAAASAGVAIDCARPPFDAASARRSRRPAARRPWRPSPAQLRHLRHVGADQRAGVGEERVGHVVAGGVDQFGLHHPGLAGHRLDRDQRVVDGVVADAADADRPALGAERAYCTAFSPTSRASRWSTLLTQPEKERCR